MLVTLSRETFQEAVAMPVLAHIVARIGGDAGGHRALAHSSSLKMCAENKVVPSETLSNTSCFARAATGPSFHQSNNVTNRGLWFYRYIREFETCSQAYLINIDVFDVL